VGSEQYEKRTAIRCLHACLQLNRFKALRTHLTVEKIYLPRTLADVSEFDCVAALDCAHIRLRNINLIPFRSATDKSRFLRKRFKVTSQDRLTHCQLLFPLHFFHSKQRIWSDC